jgi:hypothetical protein
LNCVVFYEWLFAMLASISEASFRLVFVAAVLLLIWLLVKGRARTWLNFVGRVVVSGASTVLLLGPLAWLFFPELIGVRREVGTTFFDAAGCDGPIMVEPGRGF